MDDISRLALGKAVKTIKDKGEDYDEDNTWTIKLLVDVKIVYIITYVYVSVVNLISTTARNEALEDEDCVGLVNLSSLPQHINVTIKSIDNAVLWSCRDLSITNYYYKLLYWMLIIALIAALVGFAVTKFIALCTVMCSPEHVLTKLWHLAILSQLIDLVPKADDQISTFCNHCSYFFLFTETDHQNSDSVGAVTVGQQPAADVVSVDQQVIQIHTDTAGNTETEISTDTAVDLKPLDAHCSIEHEELFKKLLGEDIPECNIQKCDYRRIGMTCIPILLLLLLVAVMTISFLSYDLHPVGCLSGPNGKDIFYNKTSKKVKINFPDSVTNFQIAAGFTVLFLTIVYLILAVVFYYCSENVCDSLKSGAGEYIEKIRRPS